MNKFYLIISNVLLVLVLITNLSFVSNAQSVKIKASPDSVLCEGQTLTLTRMYTPNINDSLLTFTVYYKGTMILDTADSYTIPNITMLDTGKYFVKIFDSLGIKAQDKVAIKVNKTPTYTIFSKMDPTKCGGTDGYFILNGLQKDSTYTLSYKFHNMNITLPPLKADAMGKIKKDNLGAGKYTKIKVKLTGCESIVSLDSLELKDPPPTPAVLLLDSEMCFGTTIDIDESPLGGVLSIFSGPGILTGNPKQLTTTNGPGNQIVVQYIYTDTLNCKDTSQSVVFINPLPIISPTIDQVRCNGGNDGKIVVFPGDYIYNWSIPTASGNMALNLSEGSYSVTSTDNKGCKYVLPAIIVTEPDLLVASNVQDTVICYNSPEVFAVGVIGGTPGYTYMWTGPAGSGSTPDVNYSKGGEYSITITDSNGCEVSETVTITENPEILISIDATTTNNIQKNHFCTGDTIALTATGSATFKWESNLNNPLSVTKSGVYIVTGTTFINSKECTLDKSIIIIEDTLPKIIFRDDMQTAKNLFNICEGSTLPIVVNESSNLFNYLWFDGDNNSNKNFTQNTKYVITVTNNLTGCFDTSSFIINYYNIEKVNIKTAGGSDYPDSSTVCDNNDTLILTLNGTISTFDNLKTEWSSNNPQIVDITTSGNNREATIKYGNGNFTLYVKTIDFNKGCISLDSVKFFIVGSETNITEINNCGLILLKNGFMLDPLPPRTVSLGNGFYFVKDSARLTYLFKGGCRDTMDMPVINPQSGFNYKMDNLIYDECGPFFLAKDNKGLCFYWYKINKEEKTHTLLAGKNDSWLKLNTPIDTAQYKYVAIGYDCNNNCDTTQISFRSDEGGKTIPCYNSGESAIKIYPNPNQGHMYLKLEGLPAGKQEIYIYDIMGRQVFKKTIDHTGNNDITELSLMQLPDGIYFAKTYYNGTGISTKFIITH